MYSSESGAFVGFKSERDIYYMKEKTGNEKKFSEKIAAVSLNKPFNRKSSRTTHDWNTSLILAVLV